MPAGETLALAWRSGHAAFEALFIEECSRLRSLPLVDAFESVLLVEMASSAQACEGPKADRLASTLVCEIDCLCQELPTNALSTQLVGSDEPSQVRTTGSSVCAVKHNRAFDLLVAGKPNCP